MRVILSLGLLDRMIARGEFMNIKEVRDEGPEPNTPTVAEMRKSQADGSKGIGLNEQSYCDDLADFNQNYAAPSEADVEDDDYSTSSDVTPQAWMP